MAARQPGQPAGAEAVAEKSAWDVHIYRRAEGPAAQVQCPVVQRSPARAASAQESWHVGTAGPACQSRPRYCPGVRGLFGVLVTLQLLYGIVLAFAVMSYKRALYPVRPEVAFVVPEGAALVSRMTPRSIPFHGVYFAAREGRPTVVVFHGNGETMASSFPRARYMAARGFGVLLAEYRGYGRSAESGTPSEEGLYDDGAAALAFLHEAGVAPARIVLWGTSLGTGVASELAASGQGSRLILCTPYTSIRDLAARVAWFLPTSLVVKERFDTLAKAPRIQVPTLVVHGDQDEVVPFAMGEAVARAIKGATFFRVPGGHHNDLYAVDPALLDRILVFAGD